MKPQLKVIIAGLAIIVISNAVALMGVAYNRSGEPEATLSLTERELPLPYRYWSNKENSGLSLKINCRLETEMYINRYGGNCFGTPDWLDRAKLDSLGFDLQDVPKERKYGYRYVDDLPRVVYLVLEFDGDAHRRVLEIKARKLASEQALLRNNPENKEFEDRVSRAQGDLDEEKSMGSRLFAIDAGMDMAALREQYPDRSHYAIIQASIKPVWGNFKENNQLAGMITGLLVGRINVPLQHRTHLTALEAAGNGHPKRVDAPRYRVTTGFGQRLEPWIIEVEPLNSVNRNRDDT